MQQEAKRPFVETATRSGQPEARIPLGEGLERTLLNPPTAPSWNFCLPAAAGLSPHSVVKQQSLLYLSEGFCGSGVSKGSGTNSDATIYCTVCSGETGTG